MSGARKQLERGARWTARTGGRLTAGQRMMPSFLIMGGQRCGTTSTYKTITQHPAVLPAALHKGVHYFDTAYERGPSWYRGHFPLLRTGRRREQALGYRPITGESSPYYLFHPLSVGRIAADLPDVKAIVLLRDPVERAYSAHTHETARGFETEDFARAIELEGSRIAGEAERLAAEPTYRSFHHQHHAYLTRGRYVDQLMRAEAALGRDRIYVVDSEDFFDRPAETFAGVLDFLGLPPDPGIVFDQHNARPRSSMDPALRAELSDRMRADDERLAAWWGRVPRWRQ